MAIEDRLKNIFEGVLHLRGGTSSWDKETRLLGSLPELDSLAVVAVLAAIEKEFAFPIDDDEINAEMIATLGTLASFIERKALASH